MGFEMAGFEIVWTNEFDPMFTKLHAAGITSWRKAKGNGIKAEIFNTKSITEVSSDDIVLEAFPTGIPANFGTTTIKISKVAASKLRQNSISASKTGPW